MALELMMRSEHVSKCVRIKIPFLPVLNSTVNYVYTRLHTALSPSPRPFHGVSGQFRNIITQFDVHKLSTLLCNMNMYVIIVYSFIDRYFTLLI